MWLLFSAIFSTESALVVAICPSNVGLTFAVSELSACNLTDQRTEAHQSVQTENNSQLKRYSFHVIFLVPAITPINSNHGLRRSKIISL